MNLRNLPIDTPLDEPGDGPISRVISGIFPRVVNGGIKKAAHQAIAAGLCLLLAGNLHAERLPATVENSHFTVSIVAMPDGVMLPLASWLPDDPPRAVVLALHAYNDFSQAFGPLAVDLRSRGIAVYAYDQRGFGATAQRGTWAGSRRLVEDAALMARWLRELHPQLPVYLLGESMGSAVAMIALAEDLPVDGAILMAPAVWARATQPWYQRFGLWLGEYVIPTAEFSPEVVNWVAIEPTDDPHFLDYWENHPMVIQSARAEGLVGLTALMDGALEAAASLPDRVLILYGGQDKVVPPEAICAMLERLPDPADSAWRFVFYPQGWHFLTRDTRAEETWNDILAWLESPQAELPSGLERTPEEARDTVCKEG